jgi:hypothetical protein
VGQLPVGRVSPRLERRNLQSDPQAGLRAVLLVAGALWLLLIGGSLLLGSWPLTAGVAIGGGIALANFQALRWLTARALGLVEPGKRLGLTSLLRWLGMGMALVASVLLLQVDPVGLAAGLTVVVVAIFIAAAAGWLRG